MHGGCHDPARAAEELAASCTKIKNAATGMRCRMERSRSVIRSGKFGGEKWTACVLKIKDMKQQQNILVRIRQERDTDGGGLKSDGQLGKTGDRQAERIVIFPLTVDRSAEPTTALKKEHGLRGSG